MGQIGNGQADLRSRQTMKKLGQKSRVEKQEIFALPLAMKTEFLRLMRLRF